MNTESEKEERRYEGGHSWTREETKGKKETAVWGGREDG